MISPAIAALCFVSIIVVTDLVLGYLDILRVTKAQQLIEKGSPYIDVDPPERYAAAHPPGSINMPYPHTNYLARKLDRAVPLVVHGHHFRAIRAAIRLRTLGFSVLNLGSARTEAF
jgi:rhodanese-related sulfurtransferase